MATETPIPDLLLPRHAPAASVRVLAPPSSGLQLYSWAVLAYNVLVVLWGAVVRATGSGNGCGEHWPLCGGTFVQHWRTLASVIEFAHRASSGLAVFALLGLFGWVWRATPRRHLARVFVAGAGVLTLNEAVLGALLVLLGLTGTNQSPWRGFFLSLHLANTLLLLAALALTADFLGRENGRMRGGVQWNSLPLASLGLAATLLVGVSGSLAALGDTLYPARSLAEAFQQDFAPGGVWLLHIRWIHPTLSVLAGSWIVYLVAQSRSGGNRRLGMMLGALVGLQVVLGGADVLLLAPTWLQITHLLGADLLWIALVILTARVCIRPIGCTGGLCGLRASRTAAPASIATEGVPPPVAAARAGVLRP